MEYDRIDWAFWVNGVDSVGHGGRTWRPVIPPKPPNVVRFLVQLRLPAFQVALSLVKLLEAGSMIWTRVARGRGCTRGRRVIEWVCIERVRGRERVFVRIIWSSRAHERRRRDGNQEARPTHEGLQSGCGIQVWWDRERRVSLRLRERRGLAPHSALAARCWLVPVASFDDTTDFQRQPCFLNNLQRWQTRNFLQPMKRYWRSND